MIQNYEQLHQLITKAFNNYIEKSDIEAQLTFQIEDSGIVIINNKTNGRTFKFMLAKFGEEYKVGFALIEQYQPKPEWIDDILSSNFDENFIISLFDAHLVSTEESFY